MAESIRVCLNTALLGDHYRYSLYGMAGGESTTPIRGVRRLIAADRMLAHAKCYTLSLLPVTAFIHFSRA